MLIHFWKYQGAGNDFIMIDQRSRTLLQRPDTNAIARLCDRHFGIGADGLILLQKHPDADFEMLYFNADGRESTFCGNGGRCIVAFAHDNGLDRDQYRFLAADGPHEARVDQELADGSLWIELKMNDVEHIKREDGAFILDTGSPHYVRFVPVLDTVNVVEEARRVRYSERFKAAGINVNFVEENDKELRVRTYERGVENETLACGTGVTASAIAHSEHRQLPEGRCEIEVATAGGRLAVRFMRLPGGVYSEIWLCGTAKAVFQGSVEI